MKKTTTLSLLSLALLCGCGEPVTHYNRVQVASLTGQPVEVPHSKHGKVKPYGSVKTYFNKAEPLSHYEVISLLSVEGEAGDEARFLTAMQYRAADMGADGLIFYRETGMATDTVGGLIPSTKNYTRGVYRGEVIRYK